jgi:hypothetical protein
MLSSVLAAAGARWVGVVNRISTNRSASPGAPGRSYRPEAFTPHRVSCRPGRALR